MRDAEKNCFPVFACAAESFLVFMVVIDWNIWESASDLRYHRKRIYPCKVR